MKKVELLAPAGSLEKAKIAFMYGADAVYAGTSKLSLRTRAEINSDTLADTIIYAHSIGKKVYVALNIYAMDEDYAEIESEVKRLDKLGADAIIASDVGVINTIKKIAPNMEIHVSTQANTVSLHAAEFWKNFGAKRVVISRELSKDKIKYIMENKPDDLDVEMFIHGAICYAYSGRCYLSKYLANRCANQGDCAQPCRWQYNITASEVNNPDSKINIDYDEKGTYLFSSKDMCLIKQIPTIIDMGVESLKIEGRLKTEYYLATIVNTYRTAIDDYVKDPKNYNADKYMQELEKTKTRGLTTFYFNDRNNKDFQEYEGKQYNPNFEFGGKVVETVNGKTSVEIKNKLSVGDEMEIIIPGKIEVVKFKIEKLWDYETDEEIETINPGVKDQKVKMQLPIEVKEGWILRRKK